MAQHVKNVYWDDVEVGQDLPEKSRPIDTTLIVSGAIWASHDFMPVHHNRDFAQEKGAPDIFMNILTSNGLMASYLEQWAGPEAELRKMNIGLQVPNFPSPDNKMDMNARITKKYEEAGDHLIELDISGDNTLGPHIVGTAVMALPKKG
jgi:hypothetical protein